jgi:enoyl-CoA hydratase/carnithine racemase
MTSEARVTYEVEGSVATIAMDDGKANVLSPAMLAELGAALDRAESDGAVVVLTGREGRFSGGFDLSVINAGGPDAVGMIRGGFELAARLLAFPTPVVIAASGHAVAMASFLLLSGDYRVGAAGPYKITANEVAIGMVMPYAAIEICRQRLAPAHFHRAVALAEVYSPEGAVEAGFLDRVVPAGDLRRTALDIAAGLAQLDLAAHAASKLRAREAALTAIRAAIEVDDAALQTPAPAPAPAP